MTINPIMVGLASRTISDAIDVMIFQVGIDRRAIKAALMQAIEDSHLVRPGDDTAMDEVAFLQASRQMAEIIGQARLDGAGEQIGLQLLLSATVRDLAAVIGLDAVPSALRDFASKVEGAQQVKVH